MPNDDAIVASLMLLLDGKDMTQASKLLVRALVPREQQTKFVCSECGGEDIDWNCDAEWHSDMQDFVIRDWGRCWCMTCDSETYDERVPIDWVKPAEEEK